MVDFGFNRQYCFKKINSFKISYKFYHLFGLL